MDKKGILNFANSSSSSSADLEETSERNKFEIVNKELEIKILKEQIEELNQQLEQERENNRHSNDREVNNQSESIEQLLQKQQIEFSTQLESFKRSIRKELSSYFQQDFTENFNKLIVEQIRDCTSKQFNNESGNIKQLVQKGIREYFHQEFDNSSISIHNLIKQEISKYIQQDFDVHLEFFRQQIQDKVRDSLSQKSSELAFLQDSLSNINRKLSSIKLLEKQPDRSDQLTSESHEQSNLIATLLKEFRAELKKLHDLKVISPQAIPTYNLNDLQSLIDTYNSKPETLSNNVIKVAATKESIEQRRTGKQTPIIFTETSNESYWIIQEIPLQNGCFYLVPKANLIINDQIYQTIEDIFVCLGYYDQTSNQFILSKPAIVKSNSENENEWELIQPGELIFS